MTDKPKYYLVSKTQLDDITEATNVISVTDHVDTFLLTTRLLAEVLEDCRKIEVPNPESPIRDLQRALETDEGYRLGWIANIAIPFIDEVRNHPEKSLHEQANAAAEQFLRNLCR